MTERLNDAAEQIADGIRDSFIATDASFHEGNTTDAIIDMTRALDRIADSIKPSNAMPGHDETGGTVDSLTEAVMGMTAGLVQIACAISDLAQAVREGQE